MSEDYEDNIMHIILLIALITDWQNKHCVSMRLLCADSLC